MDPFARALARKQGMGQSPFQGFGGGFGGEHGQMGAFPFNQIGGFGSDDEEDDDDDSDDDSDDDDESEDDDDDDETVLDLPGLRIGSSGSIG